jgi:CRISPR/Cas system CSM-associated protein Csm3 (group 7 of RAMP superfamily)
MSGRAGRQVVERVLVSGTLELETPAHFGNGDAEGLTDMPLLWDARDDSRPLLTGTSIAGALRNYVREYERGFGVRERSNDLAQKLFGAIVGKTSVQSWLMVDDALGECPGVELRDGVAIDPQTRTAEEKKKFDIELMQAGTRFDLSFELLLPRNGDELLEILALALRGLEEGEIGLGMRKRRGLGKCRVSEWRVRRYRVTTPQGLIGWLEEDASNQETGPHICDLLGVTPRWTDARETFSIDATLKLESSLLIRSGSGAGSDPDMVHLRSYRDGDEVPILSGTSLAGALRARALRIAQTVLGTAGAALVDEMFGRRIAESQDQPSGSRVLTFESAVRGTHDLVQSRVKLDRFTGGAYPQALFSQQPIFGGDDSEVNIQLTLRRPADAEIGLLLLVLKDLWTGDLPLGGESSVGRGRLEGLSAQLTLQRQGEPMSWHLEQNGDRVEVTDDGTREQLESYVQALHRYGRDV